MHLLCQTAGAKNKAALWLCCVVAMQPRLVSTLLNCQSTSDSARDHVEIVCWHHDRDEDTMNYDSEYRVIDSMIVQRI